MTSTSTNMKSLCPPSGDDRAYLLVFEDNASFAVHLPLEGSLVIGRGPSSDLRLRDERVAPAHAVVTIVDGEVVVRDLGSEGGTSINGDRMLEAGGGRALIAGDVVTIGGVSIVLNGAPRRGAGCSLLGVAQLRARVGEELARSRRYAPHMALAVVVIDVPPRGGSEPAGASLPAPPGLPAVPSMASLATRVLATLRHGDVVATDGAREIVVLLADPGGAARLAAERILADVQRVAPEARGGIATSPDDACTVDALLTGARMAARHASAGAMASLPEASAAEEGLVIGAGTPDERAIVAIDPTVRRLFALVERLAAADLPVLVGGETGAGKEIVASALHAWSKRRGRRMVAINCAAISESLFESELFGHERGAFSGAVAPKAGLIELADGGTLFLDEVGECSPRIQAKLLRVLETKRVSRVGAVVERPVDVRIVSATNRALDGEVQAGRFRQDLLFRLSAATVVLPPLRDRPLDLPVLARRFLERACTNAARPPLVIGAAAMQQLAAYPWPGNIRELKNLMEYLAATVDDETISASHLPDVILRVARGLSTSSRGRMSDGAGGARSGASIAALALPAAGPPFRNIYDEIRDLERRRIEEALREVGGVRVRASALIGMPLRTMITKIKEYGITTPSGRRRHVSASLVPPLSREAG